MNLDKKIELCEHLTPVENDIGQFILNNKEKVSEMTIQEFSDLLFISKSAIHRFCKKIGLKGYNELKIQIAKDLADNLKDINQVDVNNPFSAKDGPKEIAYKLKELYEITIRDTFKCIDEKELKICAELLKNAEKIDIYTHSHNSNIADNFQDKMLTIGIKVDCPKTFYTQRLSALASNSYNVAIILSYSGKASWILPIVKKLYENKTTIILIGKLGSNYYKPYIKHHIAISDNENLRDRISQFSSHIGLQYIMDVLYSCIYNLDRENNVQYFYNSIDFMDDRSL